MFALAFSKICLIWVMSDQKLGHQVKSEEIRVYTLEARFVTQF